MSSSEEDSYSMIFASLKHPIRRKILRILSSGPQAFSDLQKQFNIESSHLTYHIDDLRNLVYKTETGKYALSSLGKAAVSMMRNVEEPSTTLNLALPRRLGVIRIARSTGAIVLGLICIVLAASLLGAFAYYSPVINEKNEELSSLNSVINEKNDTISSLTTMINEKNVALSTLNASVSQLTANITSLQNQLSSLSAFLENRMPNFSAIAEDPAGSHLEIVNVKFEIDHIYIELSNTWNKEITITKFDIIWVAYDYYAIPSNVTEVGTLQHLPITIAAYNSTTLDFNCSWIPGSDYQAEVDFSDGSGFQRDLGSSPALTTIQGALLYNVNVNFYSFSGVPKIDLDIGNYGTEQATVKELYIWGSSNEPINLLSAPLAMQVGARSRITLRYNWASSQTYQFKVVYDSVRSLSWTEQSPSWRQDENPDPVILGFDTESTVVQKDEIFTVNVTIENIPQGHGCAGIEFNVTWDSGVLVPLNMTEVMFHTVTPPEEYDNIWRLGNAISNQSVNYAYTWMDYRRAEAGGYAPIWGNQTLATITFKALDTGSATLHFSKVLMAGPDGIRLIESEDEPQNFGRKRASLLNYVLMDCKVNVEDVASGFAVLAGSSFQTLTLVGDINKDGIVDIFDAILLANALHSQMGQTRYNADADLNGSDTVDVFDRLLLEINFNKHVP